MQLNLNYLKLSDNFIRIKYKKADDLDINKILSLYKNDENLKILKDGSVQYKQEFENLESQCHFIKEFVTKIN